MQGIVRSLVESVNGRLQVRPVLDLIGFRPEGFTVVGTRARAHCPAHRGGATFKSLQIEPQRRICQCVVKSCPAHTPLTLVELYGLAAGLTPAGAALTLAAEQELELEPDLLDPLAGQVLGLDVPAASEEELKEAEQVLGLLLTSFLAPSHTMLRQLGSIRRRLGNIEAAREDFSRAADMAGTAGEHAAQLEILSGDLLGLDPDNLDSLARAAALHRQLSPDGPEWVPLLRRRGELLAGEERWEDAAADLREVVPHAEGDAEVWLLLAEAEGHVGDRPASLAARAKAADALEREGRAAKAVETWTALVEEDAGNQEARERLEALQQKLGDSASFSAQMERLAEEAWNKGQVDRAIEFHEAVIRGQPDHPLAIWRLALLLAGKGQGDEAAEYLVRLPEDALDDELLPAAAVVAEANLDDSLLSANADKLEAVAVMLEREGKPGPAAALLEKLSRAAPDRQSLLSRLASVYTRLGRGEEARQAWSKLGELCRSRDEDARAAEAFRSALELDPADGFVLRQLYEIAAEQGDAAKASSYGLKLADVHAGLGADEDEKELLRELIGRQPDNAQARERLADACARAGDREGAARELRELYRVQHKAGNLDAASAILERLEEVDGENPETLELLAGIYRDLHDNTEAGVYLRRSARKYTEENRTEESLRVLLALSELAPHDAALHTLRAQALEQSDRLEEASKQWREAAGLLHAEGLLDEEVDALRKASALLPDDLELSERLALLYGDLDRTSEAAELFSAIARRQEKSGNLPGAVDALTSACRLLPDSPELHERLAELALKADQPAVSRAEYIWLGTAAEKVGDREAALDYLHKALKLQSSPNLELHIASLLRASGDEEGAWRHLRQLAKAKEYQDLPGGFAEAVLQLYELNPHRQNALEIVLACAREQTDSARMVQALLNGFEGLLEGGDVEEARQTALAIKKLSRNAVAVRRRLVEGYRGHGLPELAGLELSALAVELREEGKVEEALECLAEALPARQGNLKTRRLYFDLLLEAERVTDASETGMALARSLRENSNLKDAIEVCREVAARNSKDPAPRRLLAELLGDLGESTQQISELRQGAELCLEQERYAEAVEMFRELLAIRPDDTRARINYIDAYLQVGPEEDLAGDYLRLAEIHARHGAHHQATKVYEKLLDLAPERAEVHEHFIDYLLQNGQTTRAVAQAAALSSVLLEKNEPQAARDCLVLVEEVAGNSPEYFMAVARANVALDARGSAATAMRTAARLEGEAGHAARRADILSELLALDPLDIDVHADLIDALVKAGAPEDKLRTARLRCAEACTQRGKPDLAEAQYRENLLANRDDLESWRLLVELRRQSTSPGSLVKDLLGYANALTRRREYKEAVESYLNVLEIEPRNLDAHRGYIATYPKVGNRRDIVEDILRFAQLLVERSHIDEGMRYFELVMSIDPTNTVARELMSSTQARLAARESSSGREKPDASVTPDPGRTTGGRPLPTSAADYLEGELAELEKKESSEALAQVVANYRDILAVNAQNANVRVRLADVLEQMGRIPEMLDQLSQAADSFFQRGDLAASIQCCERYLKVSPGDGRMRKRLNEAILKRDAFKALESAILFTDREPPHRTPPPPRKSKSDTE